MATLADGERTVLGRRTRILFAPENFNVAEVTRGVTIARRLPPDVECVFSGYSDRNREIIEEAGFEYRLLSPRLDDADARALLALDQGRALRNPFTDEMLAGRVASERSLIR
ncbi:MAG: glycosyl transferase family 28, partial [Actinomyces succiniciruminis]|nr:glycosyl transferase family 28 [Actinomyces succiniciruminis]